MLYQTMETILCDRYFYLVYLSSFFQVFNSRSDDMIVNISTNTPVFHVQGLSSGTEYRVQIYSIQQGGRVSKHAAFETFTLQVCTIAFFLVVKNFLGHCKKVLGLVNLYLNFRFWIRSVYLLFSPMLSNSMSNLGHFKDSILLQKAQGVQKTKILWKTSDVINEQPLICICMSI